MRSRAVSLETDGASFDKLDELILEIQRFTDKKQSERIWELVEVWTQDHMDGEVPAPEYARGVYNGLVMAAREVEGDRW